jgi:hypothetical protein
MRLLCLLGFVVYLEAQMNTTNGTGECAPITAPPEIIYRPPIYTETGRVDQLSGYTSVDFCTKLVSDYASCSAYTNQLIGMVAAPIVLAVLASVFLWFYLCCRSERCCPCGLPFKQLWMVKAFLAGLLLCSFISIYCSFAGSGDFKEGANNLGLAIANVENTVVSTNQQLRDALRGCLVLQGGARGIEAGECNTGNPVVDAQVRGRGTDILAEIPNAQDPINGVLRQLNFTDTLDLIRFSIVDNAERNIDRAFYAIVGIYTLALVFGVLGLSCSVMMLNAQLCLGSINVIIAGIFIGIELGFSVGISDFCHPNPRVQILNLMQASGSTPEALSGVQYMMTCQGFNPIRNKTDDILRGMTKLQQKVCVFAGYNNTNPQCNLDTRNADEGLTQLVESTNLFFNTLASCRFFNEPLVLLTDDAVCTNMVDGLYAMWTSQMVATIFLIIALFVTPCVKERIRLDKEDPSAQAKKRSSTVVERRDSEENPHPPASVAAPAVYVAAPAIYVAPVVYAPEYVAPPIAAEAKYDDPPQYTPVGAPGGGTSEVEMDTIQRDKIGDPVSTSDGYAG